MPKLPAESFFCRRLACEWRIVHGKWKESVAESWKKLRLRRNYSAMGDFSTKYRMVS